MARKILQVSFNMDDEFERKLHEYATDKVFSKYVKRLIDHDMNNVNVNHNHQVIDLSEDNKPKVRKNPKSFL
ncbi:hypothetical protein [Radiobacillus sp. PE A8.2]|uniref:hypothetical protein n=1 Tax=Radiobacillus sp. PE A8.2 TaxID=3380349 RepID=UPI00388F804D